MNHFGRVQGEADLFLIPENKNGKLLIAGWVRAPKLEHRNDQNQSAEKTKECPLLDQCRECVILFRTSKGGCETSLILFFIFLAPVPVNCHQVTKKFHHAFVQTNKCNQ